jgi:hypothetical protein
VSAILKALRKIENESVQRSEAPPAPQRIDAREAIRKQYMRAWTVQKILIVFIPLLTLAVALWLVLSYRPFLIPESSTAAEKSTPPPSKPVVGAKAPFPEDKRIRTEATSPRAAPSNEPAPSKALPKKDMKGAPDSSADQKDGPQVQDPEFKLQAIVWSEDPESRFAVVNGVIVRAGGMIEGVSVTEIGKDHVSFKSGQRTWKMQMVTE